MALQGFLWLCWVRLEYAKTYAYASLPPSCTATQPNARLLLDTRSESLETCWQHLSWSWGLGATRKIKLPLGGVLGSGQSPGCCFSARTAAYSATRREDICTERNGRMRDESTQTRSDNT